MADDPNTPSWLHEENDATTVATNADVEAPVAASASKVAASTKRSATSTKRSVAASGTDGSTVVDEELPGIIVWMRLANIAVSIALVICAVVKLLSIPKLSAIVLAVYALMGGVLICCQETQLKFIRVMIALNFGFLFNAVWRFLFYLLLASVTFSFGGLFGIVVGSILVVVAFFNSYVLFAYPSYRKVRERIAQEEDKRIQERVNKEVKRQAIRQVVG